MKKVAKLSIILLIILEVGLMGRELNIYLSKGFCRHNFNGRIIAYTDNLINFSGWADK